MRKLLIIALLLTCSATQVYAEAVKSLRLILPPQTSPAVENIGRILVKSRALRCEGRHVGRSAANGGVGHRAGHRRRRVQDRRRAPTARFVLSATTIAACSTG